MSRVVTEDTLYSILQSVNGSIDSIQRSIFDLQTIGSTFVAPAASTTQQGPGTLGSDVVYTAIDLNLTSGTWLVYAQATLSSQSAADSKCIGLYNFTSSAYITGTASPASDISAVNVNSAHSTISIVTLASDSTLRIIALRNGGSQITIGYPGSLTDEQRMFAIRLF